MNPIHPFPSLFLLSDNFFSFPCPISSLLFAIVHSLFISITDFSLSITLLIRQVNYLNIETMRHVIGRHSHLMQKEKFGKNLIIFKIPNSLSLSLQGRVCLRMRISHLCKYYLKTESPSSSQVCVCVFVNVYFEFLFACECVCVRICIFDHER